MASTIGQVSDDNETIIANAWDKKLPPYTKDGVVGCVLSESTFGTVFPKYREAYIKECFPLVKKSLSEHGITAELDLMAGVMLVSTTRKMWDPYMIFKARDVLRLLSRSVPYEKAITVLEDDITCDIIKLCGLVSAKEKMIKRRERLVGPNGSTLKALELLTNCYILIQGNTCAAIGPYFGLAKVRKVVQETMKNIHPIYLIKTMMIMRELEKDPNLKVEDWNRFLPKFATKKVKVERKPYTPKKKPYTPFPPPQQESKIDKELASGEYFLKKHERVARKNELLKQSRAAAEEKRQLKRLEPFIPPDESKPRKKKIENKNNADVDVEKLKQTIKNSQKRKNVGKSNLPAAKQVKKVKK